MAAASGDFRALLGTLEVAEIAAENAVETIEQLIRKEYSFTLQRTLPQRFEQALFSAEGHRKKGESQLAYTSRKTTMLRELAVAGLELPDLARGLVMLRDSGLSRNEMDTLYNWAQGDFTYNRVVEMLRNLDRIPQTATMATTRIMYAGEGEQESEGVAWAYPVYPEGENEWPAEDLSGEQGVYLLEDTEGSEAGPLSEEQAQAIYALAQGPTTSRYVQHRREIQDHRLARGFPSKGKGRESGGPAAEKGKKDRSLQALIQRSRCARCGVIGHWARTCRAEVKNETSGGSAGTSTAGKASSSAYATFFVHSDVPPAEENVSSSAEQNMVLYGCVETRVQKVQERSTLCACPFGCCVCSWPVTIWSATATTPATTTTDSSTSSAKTPFLAVLDTGAQSTVCGSARWAEFEATLRGLGLNAVKTESKARGTKGIGEEAKCLGIWNTPIGIGGCNGLMSVTVLEGDIPFLLSVAMQKQFLMQLNLCKFTVVWQRIQRESTLVELSSGHLAVDILEFAGGKWTPPAEQTTFPVCLAIPAHTWIVTTELEMTSSNAVCAAIQTTSSGQLGDEASRTVVGSASAKSHQCEGRGARVGHCQDPDRGPATDALEGSGHQSDSGSGVGSAHPHDQELDATHQPGADDGVVDPLSCTADIRTARGSASTISCDQRTNHGSSPASLDGQASGQGPRIMHPPARTDAQPSEPAHELVHMQGMRSALDSTDVLGASAGGQRPCGVWPLQEQPPEGCSHGVYAMGNQHNTGSRGEHGSHAEKVGEVCRESSRVRRGGASGARWHDRDCQRRRRTDAVCAAKPAGLKVKREWLEQVKQLGQTLHLKAIRKKTRVDQEEHMVWSAHLGLYTSQGMGVTSLSREPEGKAFIDAVHVLAQGLEVSYCAIAMNVMMEGAQVLEHRDARNETGSINAVLQWGDYAGGHLWTSDGSGSKHVMEEKEKWYQFDAKATQHGVSKVQRGIRWSVILYQPGRLQQVTTSIWQELRSLGFPSCKPRVNQVWHECHGGVWFLSWLGTECFLDAKALEEWGYREITPGDCPQLTRVQDQKYAVLLSWADPIEDEKLSRLSRKERKSIEASGFVVETSDIPRPEEQ
eukprot:2921305-Amphidinium_carterae.1